MNNVLVQSIFNLSSNTNVTKTDFSKKQVSNSFKDVFSKVTDTKSDLKGNKSENVKSSKAEDKNVYKAKSNQSSHVKKANENKSNEVKRVNQNDSEENKKNAKESEGTQKTEKEEKIEKVVKKLEHVLNVDDKKLLEFVNSLLDQNQDLDIKQLAQKLVDNFSQNTNEIDKLKTVNKVENIVEDLVKDLQKGINIGQVSSDNKEVDSKSILELLQNKLENTIEKDVKTPKEENVTTKDNNKQTIDQPIQQPAQQNMDSSTNEDKNGLKDKRDLAMQAKAESKESLKQAIDAKVTEAIDTTKSGSAKKDATLDGNINLNNVKQLTDVNAPVKELIKDTVNKADIIKQVVNNAKILITNNKKEMTINLNPEHLGKLTLKVVSENGSLSAKILTENDTVKQAIESNMDSLKESLKNQGLEISQFSVSVGQEQRHHQNQNAQEMMNKISKSLKVKNIINNLKINSYDDEKVQTNTYHPDSTVSYSA